MNFVHSHGKALKAELLKLKRSGIFWLCLGSALLVPLVNTIVSFFIDVARNADVNRWDLFIQTNFQGFTGFFFPLFLVLMVVRLVYTEHRSDTWKLMETQPVSRAAIFLAKWETAAIISFSCLIALVIFSLIGGFILQLSKPEFKLNEYSISWTILLQALVRFWISSLAIISIQYFIGLLIKSFAWPMGIGLIAIIAGSILTGFGVWTWWPYSFTSLTSASYEGSMTNIFLMAHEKQSLLWSVLFLLLGYHFFVQKSFKRAVFFPLKRALAAVAILAAFISLAFIVNRPSTLSRYNKTVISGQIKSPRPVKNVLILSQPAGDTVISIPVSNGKFHASIKEPLEAAYYYLKAGNNMRPIYFGTNDSLYIDISIKENRADEKIKGTRLAENAFNMESPRTNYMLTEYAYNYKPAEYAKMIRSEWKDGLKRINEFKTVDNVKPGEDFIALQKKLLAIDFIYLLDIDYPAIHSVYYPNDSLKYPVFVDRFRKEASINDSSVAMYSQLREYANGLLKNKSGRNDSLYFAYLNDEIKNQRVRDFVLFDFVQNDVFRIKDSSRKNFLYNKAVQQVSDKKIKAHLEEKMRRMQSIQRFMKAPNFIADALNDKEYRLEDLSERYVVIDVWASWCGPCKRESPFFEDLAEQYTNAQIAFVSISVDEDKHAWRREASRKKTRSLQLWAKNGETNFQRDYAITSIPRFMLLGPKGTIINADMPPPSDPEFEAILRKEIVYLSSRNF